MSNEQLVTFIGDMSWGEFDDFADDVGLEWVGRIPQAEQQLYEEVYETPDELTEVRYIQDHYANVTFATLNGPDATQLATRICHQLSGRTQTQVHEILANGVETHEIPYALRTISAFSTSIVEPQIVAWLLNYANHPDSDIRSAVIAATGRISWQELWPVIDVGMNAEADDTLGELWQHLFDAYTDLVPRGIR